jgi:nucleotide-binding universal stress UspA family protein
VFKSILVAVDRSAHARAALVEAADIARAQAASLTVMTVYTTRLTWPALYPAGIDQETLDTAIVEVRGEAQAVLDDAVAALPEGFTARTVMIEGTAAEAILTQARQGGHDLIVVGSRGHGDAASILLGSVSHQVLHHSRVPVLVVHVPTIERERADDR